MVKERASDLAEKAIDEAEIEESGTALSMMRFLQCTDEDPL